jgi:hypothetical protein
MQRNGDTIGTGRLWLGLVCVSALVLLSGCGWLFGSGPGNTQKARPGVDRKASATGALPPATGGGHEPGAMASDPAGNAQIGSMVPGKGGQKAQKEAAEKEAAERDAKEREAREKREAEERDAKAKEEDTPANKPAANIVTGVPAKPAAAEPGNATPPTTSNAPTGPAPVTSAPVAPAQPAQPAQPAPAPNQQQPAAPPRT